MNLLTILGKTPVTFDGGMGTGLAERARASGQRLSCSEAYNLSAPEVVRWVHEGFINAGCDVIETNTFNANRLSLTEFGLEERLAEINREAVFIARGVADSAGRKVFVAGDIGPTSKLPSMWQVSFDEMRRAYFEQVGMLVDAGVDILMICTCQDILQIKAAVVSCNEVFEKTGRRLPIIVTVTIDRSGRMLLGTEPGALVATLLPLRVSAIGLNCGLGPKGMEEAVRWFCHHSPLPVAVLPNAGLPEIQGGETRYNLGADEFSRHIEYFVKELGVEIVGGCCGTTHEHISEVVKKIRKIKPKKRNIVWDASLSSLFNPVSVRQKPAPLIIGERMNINGSKKFRGFILGGDYDSAAAMAVEQEGKGVHALDISVSYAGRDEKADFVGVLRRVVTKARSPISIDSTNPDSIGEALKMIPGRPIINSINLEDGGEKARKILELARRYGAAVIALTIDREGMARDVDEKCGIARHIVGLAAEYGLGEEDIFIDPLTFTLAEPRAASSGSGAKTLQAIKKIKKAHPKINTVLGVSNVSYGFDRKVRRILNSVFLHEAINVGLDAAIVDASQIVQLSKIDGEAQKICLDLIWKRKGDSLDRFVKYFRGKDVLFDDVATDVSPEEGVRFSIIRGDGTRVNKFLEGLVSTKNPQEILNDVLLPAMGEVGKLFDEGKIPLPFVLQSAEVMKKATDILSPHFEKVGGTKKGKIVLATVRGDVHDIGKNLVDIILSNNGFEVFNIGVKQTAENILNSALRNKVDAIGLSGLLVESALAMKDDLAEFSRRGVDIPVICGGAALSKKFVEGELQSVYNGRVYYAPDAFGGLKILNNITKR